MTVRVFRTSGEKRPDSRGARGPARPRVAGNFGNFDGKTPFPPRCLLASEPSSHKNANIHRPTLRGRASTTFSPAGYFFSARGPGGGFFHLRGIPSARAHAITVRQVLLGGAPISGKFTFNDRPHRAASRENLICERAACRARNRQFVSAERRKGI